MEETVNVMIEIPKGSRQKYEYDKERKLFKLDRMLYSSVHYPSDYGFIENTLALDNDPLDALVLLSQPTFPGCLIEARPIGVFVMHDEKGQDEKILCVAIKDSFWNHINSLEDVPPHLLKEVEHFFSVYKDLEQKSIKIEGWKSREDAWQVIRDARERYVPPENQ